MQALPFVLSLAVAVWLAPRTLEALREGGHVRANYRGRELPFPAGIVLLAAAVVALVPLAALDELANGDVFRDETGRIAVYALGVMGLGLLDDLFSGAERGWRGHAAALLGGSFSTGALKAVGSLGLAMYALADLGYDDGEYLLAVTLLVLTTNLFNLLDLRPGRSVKVFVVLAGAVALVDWDAAPLAAVGLFAGPLLALGFHDVRERAMAGDVGSNLTGALAGFVLILGLSTTGQAVALAVVLVITAYGEFRSISALVERNRFLRSLDSIGRPDA